MGAHKRPGSDSIANESRPMKKIPSNVALTVKQTEIDFDGQLRWVKENPQLIFGPRYALIQALESRNWVDVMPKLEDLPKNWPGIGLDYGLRDEHLARTFLKECRIQNDADGSPNKGYLNIDGLGLAYVPGLGEDEEENMKTNIIDEFEELFGPFSSPSFDVEMVDGTHPVYENTEIPPMDTDDMTRSPGDDKEMRYLKIDGDTASSPAFSSLKSSPCPSPSRASARMSVRPPYPTPSMSGSPAPKSGVFVLPPLSHKPTKGRVAASLDIGSLMTPQEVTDHMNALGFPPISSRDYHSISEFFGHFKSLNRTMKDAQRTVSRTPEDKTLVIFQAIKTFIKDHALGPIPSKHAISSLEDKDRKKASDVATGIKKLASQPLQWDRIWDGERDEVRLRGLFFLARCLEWASQN